MLMITFWWQTLLLLLLRVQSHTNCSRWRFVPPPLLPEAFIRAICSRLYARALLHEQLLERRKTRPA